MREPLSSSRGLVLTFLGAVVLAGALLGLFALIGVGGGSAEADAIDAALVEELADGGEVLLFRHALTDTTQTDADATTRGTCAMQRNLSPEGIAQARQIGEGLRDRGLDGGPMFTSPFCRGVDTALAMRGLPTGEGADLGDIQPEESLRNLTAAAEDEAIRQQILDESVALITGQLGGPEPVVMVGHVLNIEALTGQRIEEGDAIVLGPTADGQVEVLGVIPAGDW